LPTANVAVPTIAPDLAVEILSEGNTAREISLKLTEFFQSGTRLAWVVDRRPRTVSVHHTAGKPTFILDEHGTLDGEQVMPGLTIAVGELFRNIPR
jgi:Uma2 family endonuclease